MHHVSCVCLCVCVAQRTIKTSGKLCLRVMLQTEDAVAC